MPAHPFGCPSDLAAPLSPRLWSFTLKKTHTNEYFSARLYRPALDPVERDDSARRGSSRPTEPPSGFLVLRVCSRSHESFFKLNDYNCRKNACSSRLSNSRTLLAQIMPRRP